LIIYGYADLTLVLSCAKGGLFFIVAGTAICRALPKFFGREIAGSDQMALLAKFDIFCHDAKFW
jgi:hypothetical protein